MKRNLIGLVIWMTILCNFGIIVSLFFEFMSTGKNSSSVWIYEILIEGTFLQRVLALAMYIGVLVSFGALSEFRSSKDATPSIVMLVEAIIGFCCFNSLKNGFIEEAGKSYEIVEGIGGYLTRISYILLILVAILALGIDIYIANTKNNDSGSEQLNHIAINICPKCGKKTSEEEKFCDACGFSLASLTCSNCGARRNTTSTYCKECGERLPTLNMRKSDE